MSIDYERIKKDVEGVLDINKDGKFDEKDAKTAYDNVFEVLNYNMPTGGGFGAGFILGLRK